MYKTTIMCNGCGGTITYQTKKQYKYITPWSRCQLHKKNNQFYVIKSELIK